MGEVSHGRRAATSAPGATRVMLASMRRVLEAFVRWLALALVRLYYPVRLVEGGERIPRDRPTVFLLNHPNGLLDPMVLRICLLYTSPSPRDGLLSRMPSSA